jgi:hypothetical protein
MIGWRRWGLSSPARYLDSDLRWLHLGAFHPHPTKRYCLAAAIGEINVNTGLR